MRDLVGRRVAAACNCGGGTVLVKPSERGCGGRRRLPCIPFYKRVVRATAALALLFALLAAPAGAQTPLCVDKATTGYAALEIASACFTRSGSTTVSPAGSAVWVNGMLITPTNSGTLTLNSATGTLVSSQPVTISIRCRSCDQPALNYTSDALNWRVTPNPGETAIDLGSVTPALEGGLKLFGLPVFQRTSLRLQNGSSLAAVTVKLPIPATFGAVSASGNVLSNNATGAKFDGLDLSFGGSTTPKIGKTEGNATTVVKDGKKVTVKGGLPGVNGLFAVFSGSLRFSLATNSWKGSITFALPSIGGVSGSFDVINGVVRQLAVNATYTAPGLPLGHSGLFFAGIGGSFSDYPPVVRPVIGPASVANCNLINATYEQFLSQHKALPSECRQEGTVTINPPLDVTGSATISAGPRIKIGEQGGALLTGTGDFRYTGAYEDQKGFHPWEFFLRGSLNMLGLKFGGIPSQFGGKLPAAPPLKSKHYERLNTLGAGPYGFVHVRGDGTVSAGGGVKFAQPSAANPLISVDGRASLTLYGGQLKGLGEDLLAAPPPGTTEAAYTQRVLSTIPGVSGVITGELCVGIPDLARGCANTGAGISNTAVAGCVNVAVPSPQNVYRLSQNAVQGLNSVLNGSVFGWRKTSGATEELARQSEQWARQTQTVLDNGIKRVDTGIRNATNQAERKLRQLFRISRRVRGGSVRAASHDANPDNTKYIPDVPFFSGIPFAIGAKYRFADQRTTPISDCNHGGLQKALGEGAAAQAAQATAGNPRGTTLRTGASKLRVFAIKGITAAPDVIVVGPDRRAIRTSGPGFLVPGWLVYKDKATNQTFVAALGAPKGKWIIAAVRGTSAINSVRTAGLRPDPLVTAIAARRGRQYVLGYRVMHAQKGTKVTFSESDGSAKLVKIGATTRSHGTFTFRATTQLAGVSRSVVATITRRGRVLSAPRVATYRIPSRKAKRGAPPAPRLGALSAQPTPPHPRLLKLATRLTASSPQVVVGESVTYTLSVVNPNRTPVALSAVYVDLPAGFVYVPGSSGGLTAVDPIINADRHSWLGAFVVPARRSVSLAFRAAAPLASGSSTSSAGGSSPHDAVAPTGATAPVEVIPRATVVTTGPGRGVIPGFYPTLPEVIGRLLDDKGTPISQRLLTFTTIAGGAICSATTGADGSARCPTPPGEYRVSFAGDATYKASTASTVGP